MKNLWEYIFKGSRRVSFSYFPHFALDHEGGTPLSPPPPPSPQITFRIFLNYFTIFNSSAMEHLRWSYL